ncbi:MAG: XrtA system polysaccharide deacetylase [Candidatus Methanoperedens sp.]|nr:polysaccharide deacetylase family protein [Candidatus Methanoperedens sp.]MCZ7396187.1 polysaccharide deacetylase family protein [Candidatus Methanoperedens sp.]
MVTNILTVDVEDWYMDTDISTWDLYEDRVVESTNKIIELLNESNIRATFFILGYVAEHFPDLVKRIREENHEIATHGYSHTPITQQTQSEFEEDLIKSVRILEKITGDKVMGYRACQFTVMEETAWAIDVLKRNGLKYDSSVFPIKTHLYGVPDAPLSPYHISSANIKKEADPVEEFLEIPLSVYRLPFVHKNIPIAGGFYLRLFPYWFIKYAINRINKENRYVIFYIHPWELDSDQPRVNSLKWYHYYKLSSTEKKFKKLLKEFRFASIREEILHE